MNNQTSDKLMAIYSYPYGLVCGGTVRGEAVCGFIHGENIQKQENMPCSL